MNKSSFRCCIFEYSFISKQGDVDTNDKTVINGDSFYAMLASWQFQKGPHYVYDSSRKTSRKPLSQHGNEIVLYNSQETLNSFQTQQEYNTLNQSRLTESTLNFSMYMEQDTGTTNDDIYCHTTNYQPKTI